MNYIRKLFRILIVSGLVITTSLFGMYAAEANTQIDQIQSQLAGLDPVTDDIKAAISNIQGAINKSNQLKNQLDSAIETDKKNKELLAKSEEELEQSKEELDLSTSELEEAKSTLEEALAKYNEKEAELKEKLDLIESIKSTLVSEKEKLDAKKAEIVVVIEQIKNKQDLVSGTKSAIASLESSISALNGSINSQSTVVNNIKSEVDSLNTTISSLTTAITNQQSVVSTAQSEYNVTQSALTSATNAVSSQETVVATALTNKTNAENAVNNAGSTGLQYTVYDLLRDGYVNGQHIAVPGSVICTGVLNSGSMNLPVCGNRYYDVIVKFTGKITVPSHWTSTKFAGYTDDGFRMYVNGNLAVNNWVEQGTTWSAYSPIYDVSVNKTLNVEIWWYNGGGPGSYLLGWAIPGGFTTAGCDYTGGWGVAFSCNLNTFSHGAAPTQEQLDARDTATALYNVENATLQSYIQAKSVAQSNHDTKTATLSSANSTLASLISQKNSAQSSLSTASSNLEKEQVTLDKLLADSNALKNNLTEKQNELAKQEAELAELESNKTTLESEQSSIESEISNKETELSAEESNSQNLTEEKSSLYLEYQTKETEKTTAESKLESSKSRVEKAETDFANKTTESENSEKKIEDTEAEKESVEDEISDLSSSTQDLIAKTKEEQRLAKIEEAKEEAREAAESGGVITEEQKELIVNALFENAGGNPITAEAIAESGIDYEDLPPDTPVELENGVVLTAEVADALEVFEDVGELFSEVFSDPGKVLMAFANVGADMSPEVREKAEDIVVVTVIVGQIVVAGSILRR